MGENECVLVGCEQPDALFGGWSDIIQLGCLFGCCQGVLAMVKTLGLGTTLGQSNKMRKLVTCQGKKLYRFYSTLLCEHSKPPKVLGNFMATDAF